MTKNEIREELQRVLRNHIPEPELSAGHQFCKMNSSNISENIYKIMNLRLHNK